MSIRYVSSHISVKAYDHFMEDVGRVVDSRKGRITEIEALMRMASGDPVPATDTIGEARRAGKCRCPRCNQYQDKSCFSAWTNKETGKTYQKTLCNGCRYKIDKAKHMRDFEIPSPYPTRIA